MIHKETQLFDNEVKSLKKELKAYKSNEKIFRALFESAVSEVGEEFFHNIVKKLSEWLNAECVIIGRVVAPNLVEGFPMYLDGDFIKGFSYHLENTPCDLTSKKGFCCYNDNVKQIFPLSKDLFDLNAKGYVGIALYNKHGEANGILCAISRKPLILPPQAEEILKIVGARITAELEQIRTRKELEVSEENLKKVNATKDRLFSIIAHDLKSPFNALKGFSELLDKSFKKGETDKIKQYCEIISTVTNQTFNLLTNLLDWSLSQTNDIVFNPQNCKISEILNEILKQIEPIALQKNIVINSYISPSSNAFLDKDMIQTVFRNLICNSLKFTQQGGFIFINAQKNNDFVTFSVSDTGIGMEASDVANLFNLNERVNTLGTENETGSGLGLILCKEFIIKHKGKIWAESQIGIGTTVFFTIPANNN